MPPTKKANAKKAAKSKDAAAEAAPRQLQEESAKCKKILDDVDTILDAQDDLLKAFVILLNSTEKNEKDEVVTVCSQDDPEHILRALKKIEVKAERQSLVLKNMVAALSE